MAQKDSNIVLALTARRVDKNGIDTKKLSRRLDKHCNAPIWAAHPDAAPHSPDPEPDLDDDEIAIRGTLTSKSLFKFIILIILAASGGAALSWIMNAGIGG